MSSPFECCCDERRFMPPSDESSLGAGEVKILICVKSKTEGAAKFCRSIKKNWKCLGFRVCRFRFLRGAGRRVRRRGACGKRAECEGERQERARRRKPADPLGIRRDQPAAGSGPGRSRTSVVLTHYFGLLPDAHAREVLPSIIATSVPGRGAIPCALSPKHSAVSGLSGLIATTLTPRALRARRPPAFS